MTPESIPVELVGVRVELPTNTPIVLLREVGGSRHLPIFIGAGEATAIAFALEGVEPQRPMTHDLLKSVVESLGTVVSHVLITALRDGIYYADLVLDRDGAEVRVSARPSDAIALAARTGSPLFVAPAVLDEAGVELQDEDEESEVARFRSFLDQVDPEDFQAES
ncbi:MAG TPA: bifunctional nuclease family protein [Acidimicrobiia bacterium]|nr:bifunctional nuclease family protein [Acidimicrobiia bacterium]